MANKEIHKADIKKDCHACGNLEFDKDKSCCSDNWKKVTCEKCLKIKVKKEE